MQSYTDFIVGRDETYLKHSIKYSDWFVIEAGLIGILPKSWRPYFAPFLTLPMHYHAFFIRILLKPTYDQRIKILNNLPENDVPEPLDHLQMMMKYAQKDRPKEFNLKDIAKRVGISNIGSIHQSSIAMTNIIFNILESDAKYDTIALIRSEITNFFTSDGGKWKKANVAKMYKLDSIIRETLRIHSFGNRGVMRQVKVDNLVTEDGFLLPKGAEVSILAHPSQTDPDNFPNPDEFDPFRFSRSREAAVANNTGENTSQNAFISTGATHLAFGHGKHACPGRFILDFELKMMLCCVFGRYDLTLPEAYKGKRPPVKWVAEAQMLQSWGDVLVKRREVSLC
jgi:cytochrome P450